MLFQIHHQPAKFHDSQDTIFCIQSELPSGSHKEQTDFLQNIIAEAWEKYPPPEGYIFMFCTEDSKHFLKTKAQLKKAEKILCEVCETEFSIPSWGKGICPECGQEYVYNEGIMIVLTEKQKELLLFNAKAK